MHKNRKILTHSIAIQLHCYSVEYTYSSLTACVARLKLKQSSIGYKCVYMCRADIWGKATRQKIPEKRLLVFRKLLFRQHKIDVDVYFDYITWTNTKRILISFWFSLSFFDFFHFRTEWQKHYPITPNSYTCLREKHPKTYIRTKKMEKN